MAFQGTKIRKISAQEEEDKRLAEQARKRADEEEKARLAEEKRKAEEEKARKRKEADLIGAKDAERLSQNSGTKTSSAPKQTIPAAGTKRGLNDSMAKRLHADEGVEIINHRKQQKAAKAAFDSSFTQEKAEMAKIKGKPEPMSDEEIYRLLYLDETETRKRIDELKGQRHNYGGTAEAVSAGWGTKSPVTGKPVDYDEERENEIANLERDMILHGQLQKENEYLQIQWSSEKMEAGAKGYGQWVSDQKAAKERKQEERAQQGNFEKHVLNSWNTPDMSIPSGNFTAAVNAYREDTSENEPNDQWTAEQKYTFGYLYSIGDYAGAAEYARRINNAYRNAENQKIIDDFNAWAMKNGGRKFVADVGSVALAGLDGINYLDALAQQAAQGYITESAIPLPGDIRNAYRSERAEELNRKYGTLGDSDIGLGTGYSIMMSSLDSMAAAYTGGKAGALMTAFGGSASAALDDALERGATSEQALGYAALVGGAELLPEYLSVDSLFKLMDAKDAWALIGNIGKQAGTEGLEGFITALSAKGVDDVIMGELSNFNVAVNNYMLAGYSREEAEHLARNEVGSGVIFDTIAEALGGGFSGGVVTGINTAIGGNKTEVPVPFEGNAQPGTEQGMIADKITEIENRPISDAEKAAKMEEVITAVAETTQNPEVIAEAEKFKNIHEERAIVPETQQNPGETVSETQQEGLFGPEIYSRIFGVEDPKVQAQMDEVSEIGNRLGIDVAFSRDIISDGLHTADGRIYINPDAKNPLRQVLVHELTHEIESSGFYGNLSETILDYAQRVHGVELESMRRGIREDYSIIGQEIRTAEDADKEIVAKFAEQYLFRDENSINRLCNTNPNLFQRIRYWISDMIVKFRGTSEEQFLRNAEKLYARAWATRGEIQGAGVEQYHYSSNLSSDIEKIINGERFTNQIKVRDFTPQALVDRGIKNLPMYMNASHIRENILSEAEAIQKGFSTNASHYHGLGKKLFIKAINSMDGPIEVFRWNANGYNNYDADDYLIITETKDTEGNSIIIPIVIDSTARANNVFIDVNEIKSVYGKRNLQNYIEEYKRKHAITKVKEKSQTTKAGVQSSGVSDSAFSNTSLPQGNSGVNSQSMQNGEENAFGRSYEEMLNTQNLSTEQAEATPSMKRADGGKTAEDWKSIAERINSEHKGIWRMKDFSRVLDQASGNDKGLRQQLYELYEKPLNEAQGSYAKKYAEKAKQITAKFKELGIKAKSNESKAVQRIGEGVKEINKRGETVEYTIDDLKKDFPDSWQQIKEGADFCREVYDEFLHDLNAMYESIYPATVEQARERISSYDKGILRDESKIEHFREVIENLEVEKTEKQNQLSKKKPTTLIYAQLQSQIDNIDARIAKAESIIGRLQNRELVKKISRETLNAQIENGEILRNKQIKPRKDYFRHFQELTNEFAEIADIFSNDQRIPPNLAGKSADTKPRTIWTSIAQRRAGENYYTEDAVGGLLQYTEIAEKLLAFDPLISHFRDVNSAIRAAAEMADNEVKGKGTNAGQFAAYADKLTNKIAGKSDTIDRWLSDEWGANGRAIMKAVEVINRRVKSNAILGNFRSAIVQIGNLPNASLYIQNPIDWVKGAVTLLNGLERDENIRNARARSNFMNRRYMGDAIDEVTKEIRKNGLNGKFKDFALWMLGAGDRFGAELIWHTAYTKALNNPKVLEGRERGRAYESAIDYADDITRRSVGGRAEGDVPLHMDSKWYSLIAPFQIEVANTFNAAKEAFGDKNWVGLAAFEISVFFMNCLLEGITGDRPLGLDFIQAADDVWMEATGADDEEEEEKDFWDIATYAAGRFGGELLSGMPLGTQIGSFVTGGDEQKAEAWFGDSDPTRYGTGNIGMGAIADAAEYFIDGETPKKLFELATDGHKNSYEEWSVPVLETVDTFAPVALPWGGKQLSRTLQGADQIIRGGAYGTEADGTEYLKFLQGKELDDFYKTLLFGKYAGSTGQEYIDSGFNTSLSGKQTEQMKMAEYFGVTNEEFYSAMMELRGYNTKAAKQEALFALDISENAKNVIDGILWGGMTYKDETPQGTRNYSSAEAFYTSGLMAKDFRLHEMGFSESEIENINKALKKSGTKAGDIENLANALGITEAEAFELYQRRNGDWIETAEELSEEEAARASGAADFYGMSTEDYIAVLNLSNLGTLVDGEYKTSAKYVIPKIAEILNVDTETATDMYRKVHSFDYSRADLEESQIEALDIAQNRYGVDDYGYFVAKNAAFIAEGEKDEWGNTVEGSAKAEAIANIAKQLGIDESEATIYYLAAEGELILSVEELTSSHRDDLVEAKKYGWTEMQYINAVNVLKVAEASKKDEIIKALMDAGASYAMAQGYYNLRQNKDYDRYVGKTTVAYGMSTQKQADKVDYFVGNYNSDGNVSTSDVSKWVKATKGIRKKAEYISACMDAGATYQQAVTLYALMMGHDDNFNAWYKENGG